MTEQITVGMDTSHLGVLGGVLTGVFLLIFVYWSWWAYSPSHRARHEEAGRMPLEGGES